MKESSKEFKVIQETARKLVFGGEKEYEELKKLTKTFFKNKIQKDIDLVKKEEIQKIIRASDVLKQELSENAKAYIDFIFNQPMKKYCAVDVGKEMTSEQLRKFTRQICGDEPKIEEKLRKDLLLFIADIWIATCPENTTFENSKKDFFVDLSIHPEEDPLYVSVLILAAPEYELALKRIKDSLK
ncbi:MAG: hypothetical protein WCI72_06550 [archaeon]